MSQGLRKLFSPVDPAELVQAFRDNRRLHRRTNRAEAFAALLPWATLNSLITSEALISGRLSLIRLGVKAPLEMISALQKAPGQDWLATDKIQQLCHQGMSCIFNNIDKQVPEIAAMNAMVERFLRCQTFTNAYASFNKDSAFKAHFDPHHVLIMQIHGRKRWWCHGQVNAFPIQARVFSRPEDLPSLEWEGVLEPGDILFIPRGDVHYAKVEGENSLHLTVTLTPPHGADVLTWLAGQSLKSESLRQYVPFHEAADDVRAYEERLRQLLHGFVENLDLAEFLTADDKARPPARAINLGLSQDLAPTTKVQPTLRRRVDLPPAEGPEIVCSFGDVKVSLTRDERDTLAALIDADVLTIGELASLLPDTDTQGAIGKLARKSLVFLFDGKRET